MTASQPNRREVRKMIADQKRTWNDNRSRTERMELREKLREEYDAGLDDVDGRYSQEDSDARA